MEKKKTKKIAVKRVGLRVNPKVRAEHVDSLTKWLKRNGCEVTRLAPDESPLPEGLDLLVVMGGDGTLLGGARSAAATGVPIIGLDFGGLGFLSQVKYEDARGVLRKILGGDCEVDERLILQAQIVRGKKRFPPMLAVNDVVITKSSVRLLKLKVFINDEYFHEYPGDGVILSSATGSTAYSLSAGGPIVSPGKSVMVLTPICPHTLFARSLVLSGGDHVRVETPGGREDTLLTLDGQLDYPLEPGDKILVRAAPQRARFVRAGQQSFFQTVRVKFKLP